MFIKRGTVLFVLVGVGVEESVATMLKEDTELEVTEGEEEGEEEGDPLAVTEGDEVGITVIEPEEEGVVVTDGEEEGVVVTEGEEEDVIVILGDTVGVIVALAVVADPRAQQRVTLVEKVLPSINWQP